MFAYKTSGANRSLRRQVAASPQVRSTVWEWFDRKAADWNAARRDPANNDIYRLAQEDGPGDFSGNLTVVIEDVVRQALDRVTGTD
jgi:hypothetical protein